MADPLSVTASVAGLIGLVGSILEGCLFLKNFAKDAKNAPKDISNLAIELSTMETAVKTFEALVMDYWSKGYITSIDDYTPALKQCLGIVDDMSLSIKTDVAAFKDGSGGCWNKLKAAGKKSDITEGRGRLTAAINYLQVVQNNLQR